MDGRILLGILMVLGIFSGCKDQGRELEAEPITELEEGQLQEEDTSSVRELLDAVEGDPDLGTFAVALNAWNVEDTLAEVDPEFTVFAPNNTAYSQIYQDHGKELIEANADDVVAYHLVKTGGITNLQEENRKRQDSIQLETLQGEEITFALAEGNLLLKGGAGEEARVVDSLQGPNGMVYIIDGVLLPDTIETEVVVTEEE